MQCNTLEIVQINAHGRANLIQWLGKSIHAWLDRERYADTLLANFDGSDHRCSLKVEVGKWDSSDLTPQTYVFGREEYDIVTLDNLGNEIARACVPKGWYAFEAQGEETRSGYGTADQANRYAGIVSATFQNLVCERRGAIFGARALTAAETSNLGLTLTSAGKYETDDSAVWNLGDLGGEIRLHDPV